MIKKEALTALFCILSLILLIPKGSADALVFPKETLFFDRLEPGNEQVKLVNDTSILFNKLGITTNTNVTRAKITVQAMPDCPENAPYQANVLQCFIVNFLSIEDKDISGARIFFKVPKDWITTNDFGAVELRRYSYSWNVDGNLSSWERLSTLQYNSDDKYNFYEAKSDGLSYFSIVGVEKNQSTTATMLFPDVSNTNAPSNATVVETATAQMQTTLQDPVAETPAQVQTVQQAQETQTNQSNSPNYVVIFVLVVMLIAIGIAIPVMMPKSSPAPMPSNNFRQLADYVRFSKDSTDKIRTKLKKSGWKNWQIELGLKEGKR